MGVQNLWQLLESTGRPVNMNKGLEGKVLAIDISIWLHQAVKGMRDRQNSHILLLLNRICKLLHFKIKPIFIFDGGIPELKRRTLAERRQRREIAATKAKEANKKVRTNYLKMLAIQQLKGETNEPLPPMIVDDGEKDMFELPDTHLRAQFVDDDDDDDEEDENEVIELERVIKNKKQQRTIWSKTRTDNDNSHYVLPEIGQIDESALDNLPVEMQHDILTEIKERLKRGRYQIEDLPQKSDDFSDYQVQKLLKQNSVSQKMLNLNKAIKRQKFDIPSESNDKIIAGKLASDANTQYVLVKSNSSSIKQTPTSLSIASATSSPSPSFSRQSTNDFSANNMMHRDPVISMTPRRPITTVDNDVISQSDQKQNSTIIIPSEQEENDRQLAMAILVSLEKSPRKESVVVGRSNEEENIALALAIKNSLDDQQEKNHDNDDDSSSDSDDADFIDVPPILQRSEPIILPELTNDDSDEIIETSNNNTSTEIIELADEDDDSSHNSTAIEDIKMFINDNDEQPTSRSELPAVQLELLNNLEDELIDDTAVQLSKMRGNERLTTTLSDTMHEDTQYLLRLFGIPYLVSPTEAEAQCAYLDLSQQCDGVITDDSDVWLFGASHVYRHFFRQNQLVEYYDDTIIFNQLGLDRETMIAIAMIVGSDYTKGIPNAGIMTAIEILQEFQGTCMERLEKFQKWWTKAQEPEFTTKSKVLKRLKTLQIFEGFPNSAIYDAYIQPKINDDIAKFTWAMPQLELIREFVGNKLKWDRQKIDEMILPVIKRMNIKEVQSRIDSFFLPFPSESTSHRPMRNTRIRAALDLLKQRKQDDENQTNELNLSENDNDDDRPSVTQKTRRRKKMTKEISKRKTSANLSDDETF